MDLPAITLGGHQVDSKGWRAPLKPLRWANPPAGGAQLLVTKASTCERWPSVRALTVSQNHCTCRVSLQQQMLRLIGLWEDPSRLETASTEIGGLGSCLPLDALLMGGSPSHK